MKLNVMSKMINKGKKICDYGKVVLDTHGPAIATGISIASWTMALILTAVDAPKAHDKWKEKKEKDPEASKLELMASVAPIFWREALLAGTGVAGEVLSLKLNNARVMAATSLAVSAIAEKNDAIKAMKEVVSPEQAEEIEKKISEKKVERIGSDPSMDLPETKKLLPFKLECTGKTWWDTIENVTNHLKEVKKEVQTNGSISIGELYDRLEIKDSCMLELEWTQEDSGYEDDEFYWDFVPFADEHGRLGWEIQLPSPKYPF